MTIPLTLFLVLYGVAVIAFLLFSFFLLYHAVRFGQVSVLNVFTLLGYTAGALALIFLATQFIDAHDWSGTINPFSFLSSIFY